MKEKLSKRNVIILIIVSVIVLVTLFCLALPAHLSARRKCYMNACKSYLEDIATAKEQLAMTATNGQVVMWADVDPYLYGGTNKHVCPSGGRYTLNPIGKLPQCSIPSHQNAFLKLRKELLSKKPDLTRE